MTDDSFNEQLDKVKAWGDEIRKKQKDLEKAINERYSTLDLTQGDEAQKLLSDLTDEWTTDSITKKIVTWASELTVYVGETRNKYIQGNRL